MRSYTPGLEPSPLSTWMEQITPCPSDLAWCHSTDVFALQQIIRRGELRAMEPCDVFGERLSYFFYGRPAYKRTCAASIRTTARAPVVIMMSSDILASRKRVFPFDTGAFDQGKYSAWLHESMELRDFDLTRLVDSPRRYVPSFYASNWDYLRLKPRLPTVPYSDYYQVEALVSMINDTDGSRADDRRLAIELQIEKPIAFAWPQVRALILPRDLESTSYLSSFLAGPGRGVEVRWFDVAPLKLATEYQALLEHLALEFHKDWRLL
jgi:hypothetical protein